MSIKFGRHGFTPREAVAAVASVLALSGILSRPYSPDPTHPRLRRWYKHLDKSALTPPDAVFGGVWQVLLSALGYGTYRLLRLLRLLRRPPTPQRNTAVALSAATVGLVTLYSKITFENRDLTGGTRESAVLVATAAAYVAVAAQTDTTAAALGAPLALWSSFGGWLTHDLARRNPGLDAGA